MLCVIARRGSKCVMCYRQSGSNVYVLALLMMHVEGGPLHPPPKTGVLLVSLSPASPVD